MWSPGLPSRSRYLAGSPHSGAHAVLFHRKPHTDPLRMWAERLIEKKPFKLVAVALAKATRPSLGLKVTAETKLLIEELARSTGRTQSQQAEYLIEAALQYERTLAGMRMTLQAIEKGNVEAALWRQGWRPIRAPATGQKLWASPASAEKPADTTEQGVTLLE